MTDTRIKMQESDTLPTFSIEEMKVLSYRMENEGWIEWANNAYQLTSFGYRMLVEALLTDSRYMSYIKLLQSISDFETDTIYVVTCAQIYNKNKSIIS